jgi:hypothetical protein
MGGDGFHHGHHFRAGFGVIGVPYFSYEDEGCWWRPAVSKRRSATATDLRIAEIASRTLLICLQQRAHEYEFSSALHKSGLRRSGSDGGSTSMWKTVLDEAREVVWIVSVVGGLSAVAVGIAVALVVS